MIREPVGVLVEMSGQRIVGMRGFDGAGHPSLDSVEAGREAKRLLGGRGLPRQQLRPRRPELEFRNDSRPASRGGTFHLSLRGTSGDGAGEPISG